MKMFQAKIVNDETAVRSPEPLKVGDVVRLKSGGPLMTVSGHNNGALNDYIGCIWFETGADMVHVLRVDCFPPTCLDVYEPDNKGD